MYENILLPVDEGTESSGLLHHAAEIAHWADAEITLLSVADTTRDSVTVADGEVLDTLVESGENLVDETSRLLDSLGVDYTTDVVQGAPAQTIVDYAERYEYDLVAMPTHGREGLSRYLLGSVTEKVVRLSSVPVLTAHADEEALSFPYEGILLPTDGSNSAQRAAEHALSLADELDATLHAISVTADSLLGEAANATAAEEAINAVVEAAEARGFENVETHIEAGKPDEVILSYVESHGLDAVVMGTTGRRGIDRVLLGSVAEKTVRSATVPVVTVGGE
jgi:Universal stress protein UspA and related nucleotide-binding proteins